LIFRGRDAALASEDVGAPREVEPVVVDDGDAISRGVDEVHQVVVPEGLVQPSVHGALYAPAVLLEHRERAVGVRLAQEEVQVLGVAVDAGMSGVRVGSADQEWDVRVAHQLHGAMSRLQLIRVAISLGERGVGTGSNLRRVRWHGLEGKVGRTPSQAVTARQ
jgi:hypothetical protein